MSFLCIVLLLEEFYWKKGLYPICSIEEQCGARCGQNKIFQHSVVNGGGSNVILLNVNKVQRLFI